MDWKYILEFIVEKDFYIHIFTVRKCECKSPFCNRIEEHPSIPPTPTSSGSRTVPGWIILPRAAPSPKNSATGQVHAVPVHSLHAPRLKNTAPRTSAYKPWHCRHTPHAQGYRPRTSAYSIRSLATPPQLKNAYPPCHKTVYGAPLPNQGYAPLP